MVPDARRIRRLARQDGFRAADHQVLPGTRQSQFAVSRLFWFIAALDGFYRAETLLASVIFGVLSLIMMVTASLRADSPTRSSFWMRMIALLLLVIDILAGAITGAWAGVEFWLFVLLA
jgi:hypothetical protein